MQSKPLLVGDADPNQKRDYVVTTDYNSKADLTASFDRVRAPIAAIVQGDHGDFLNNGTTFGKQGKPFVHHQNLLVHVSQRAAEDIRAVGGVIAVDLDTTQMARKSGMRPAA